MPLINFRAPEPTVKAIKKAARAEGCTVSEWLRQASLRTIERDLARTPASATSA